MRRRQALRKGFKSVRMHVRAARPQLEGLEDRLLLYSDLGDQWTYSSRMTYSFMPDGTSVGGVPSALFQTLNAKFATATWENQIEQATALWEGATNANLALVSDGGQPVGTAGDQQDDPRFGDIRIGAVPLPSGTLAETFLPPPANGGTSAGDILLNSNVNWQIGSSYDLMTVVAHEFGHSLGLGESSVSTAVMYGTYNAIKQALTSDDIAGIQSIYGTRQFDQFNDAGQRDNTFSTATNLNAYICSNLQIALPGLDITTGGDSEWFYVNVPSSTTGTMGVTVQSSNLSSLSPKFQIYSQSLSLLGSVSAVGSLGATISWSTSAQAGQGYYIKVTAAGGPGPIGGYGLLVNFGNQPVPPIPPPNTLVAQQPNESGGTSSNVEIAGAVGVSSSLQNPGPQQGVLTNVGSVSGWVELMTTFPSSGSNQPGETSQNGNKLSRSNSWSSSSTTISTVRGDASATVVVSIGPLSPAQGISMAVIQGPSPTILQAVDDMFDRAKCVFSQPEQ
jgi:Matrixin